MLFASLYSLLSHRADHGHWRHAVAMPPDVAPPLFLAALGSSKPRRPGRPLPHLLPPLLTPPLPVPVSLVPELEPLPLASGRRRRLGAPPADRRAPAPPPRRPLSPPPTRTSWEARGRAIRARTCASVRHPPTSFPSEIRPRWSSPSPGWMSRSSAAPSTTSSSS